MNSVASFPISRRSLLAAAAAAALGCGRRKARAFPGYCFVANRAGRTVAAVDLSRFRVARQIALDAGPDGTIARPNRPLVYVLTPDNGTVHEIEAPSLSITRRARAGNQALAMLITPAGDGMWVLYRDPPALVELPFQTLRPNRRIRLPSVPDGFDISTGNQAAVASYKDRSVTLVSLDKATVDRTIDVGAEPSLLRFRGDGKQLITAGRSERLLSIFDIASGKVVVRLPLGIEPRHFCPNADGGQLFISGDGMDAVVIVFPYTTEVDQTILAGHAPGAMTVTAKPPTYLFVANPASDDITVFDIDTRKLVAVVGVGREPGAIVVTPDEEYALVLNQKSGDLAVVRILSLAKAPNGSQRRYKSAPLFTMIPVGEGPVSAAVVSLG
jgi:YVTN family beta-propeller protein